MNVFSDKLWGEGLMYVIGAIVAGLVLHYVFKFLLRKGYFFKNKEQIETVIQKVSGPARWLLVLVFIYLIYPQLPYLGPTVKHALTLLLIANIAWLLIRSIAVARIIVMAKYDMMAADNLEARKAYTQFHMIENILNFLIVVLCIGIMLMTFEGVRQVGVSLLTSAGIAGIILGFAAQKLIATILAGVQIAITQPIRIDDVVVVEGEWGRIEEINLTFVVVNIWDQRRLVLPTTYFIEQPFQNWTRNTSQILGTVFIQTDYYVPFNAIREEMTRLLEGTELWDKRVNVMQVTDAKDRTVEMRLLVSAKDSPTAWDLRVYLREKMIEFLRENYPESLPYTRIKIKDKVDLKHENVPENH